MVAIASVRHSFSAAIFDLASYERKKNETGYPTFDSVFGTLGGLNFTSSPKYCASGK